MEELTLWKQPFISRNRVETRSVIGTGTMVTDGFPLGLVLFQDTSLVAVAFLSIQEVSLDT